MTGPLITAPGAYPGIDIDDYHRNPNLLPEPSLSSSGAKLILKRSAHHFWAESPMNPQRPPEGDLSHLKIGRAAHDIVLLPEEWKSGYYLLPKGFAWNKTVKCADVIEAANHAIARGKTVLTYEESEKVQRIAESIGLNSDAMNALRNGLMEQTLVVQDQSSGVWLRARPDFLPNSIVNGGDIRVISDLKFMAPTHCTPDGFSKAIDKFGYHQSYAFYGRVIEAIFGHSATNWVFIVVEKEFPYTVSLYELPHADLMRGDAQNRIAIDRFAQCLSRGTEAQHWPAYTPEIEKVGLPVYARRAIDNYGSVQAATLIEAADGE